MKGFDAGADPKPPNAVAWPKAGAAAAPSALVWPKAGTFSPVRALG